MAKKRRDPEVDPKRLPKLPKEAYEAELERLQAELVTMQQWVKETGNRVVILFEGRDAAGKGSAIKRITQYLNPRSVRIAALPAPTERQKTQWYFQRYIEHLPAAGEIVIFDRSWYNRAGVERVMGFCTDAEYERFLRQVPVFEQMLIDDGIILRKYWFSVSDVEQEKRFRSRLDDPMRRWKLSPMDVESITRWEDYSRAKDRMFAHTDLPSSPWFVVESEDKKRSRLNVIKHLLDSIPYLHIEPPSVEIPKRPKAVGYVRPPRDLQRYVPDHAQSIVEPGAEKAKGKKKSGSGKADAAANAERKAARKKAKELQQSQEEMAREILTEADEAAEQERSERQQAASDAVVEATSAAPARKAPARKAPARKSPAKKAPARTAAKRTASDRSAAAKKAAGTRAAKRAAAQSDSSATDRQAQAEAFARVATEAVESPLAAESGALAPQV